MNQVYTIRPLVKYIAAFLAVQGSSIGDIASESVSYNVYSDYTEYRDRDLDWERWLQLLIDYNYYIDHNDYSDYHEYNNNKDYRVSDLDLD